MKIYDKILNVLVVLILLYATNGAFFFSNLLQINFGLNLSIPIPLFFLALPASCLISIAILNKRLRLPYFTLFLLVEVLFFFMESTYFRGIFYEPSYEYGYQLLIFYMIFISLINFGLQNEKANRLFRYYLAITAFIVLLAYLGYMGIINYYLTQNTAVTFSSFRPIGGSLQTNGLSMICCIGIYLLTINRLTDRTISTTTQKYELLLIVLYISMIIINSSRGVFLITLPALFFYFQQDWSHFSRLRKVIVVYIAIIIIGYVTLTLFINEIVLIQRFRNPGQWVSRLRQIYVTWINFIRNPLIGTGYSNVGQEVIYSYSRSNFHYTQILASHGLVFFPFFIGLLVKFYGFELRNKVGFLITFIGFTSLFFYNWTLLFCLAPLLYLKYYLNKNGVIE